MQLEFLSKKTIETHAILNQSGSKSKALPIHSNSDWPKKILGYLPNIGMTKVLQDLVPQFFVLPLKLLRLANIVNTKCFFYYYPGLHFYTTFKISLNHFLIHGHHN